MYTIASVVNSGNYAFIHTLNFTDYTVSNAPYFNGLPCGIPPKQTFSLHYSYSHSPFSILIASFHHSTWANVALLCRFIQEWLEVWCRYLYMIAFVSNEANVA